MRLLRHILAVGWSLLACSASAQSVAPGCPTQPVYVGGGFNRGEDLFHMSEGELRSTVSGFVNGLMVSTVVGADEGCMRFHENCFSGKTDSQLAAVVRQFLAENPGRWDQPAAILTVAALGGMCRDLTLGTQN